MTKVRHVLGISGGKDSAALAIYMKTHYPQLDIEYYTSDTGKELEETYELIERLEGFLQKPILKLNPAPGINDTPFDHFLKMFGGYLPSANARWCTKKLKLEPFEKFVGDGPVISYVGIRGDEDRDGYISKKSNIQSIFPFRQNIWSEDVISKFLSNSNISKNLEFAEQLNLPLDQRFLENLSETISHSFTQSHKIKSLLDLDTKAVNHLIFHFLRTTQYPIAQLDSYPLLDNVDVLKKEDIFNLLEENFVGIPGYYKEVEFSAEGKTGQYARSRSGCYFCFYQQKIEWVWLYEQHPDLFAKAMEYEKDGYSWNQEETLEQLIVPERMAKIKSDQIKRLGKKEKGNSSLLLDILGEDENDGCASCFI